MDDPQLTPYKKKTISRGSFRVLKAEKSEQRKVDVKGNGAGRQQDLHLFRKKNIYGGGCDQ